MDILFVLIPLAIVLVIVAVIAFFWAVKHRQFDDLERHSMSILLDDDPKKKKDEN